MKPKLDEIITRIGVEAFAEACEVAWKEAPGTGRKESSSSTPNFALHVEEWLHDDPSLTPAQRIALLFAIYERMPCYALLMTGPKWCAEDCPIAQKVWEAKVRELLGADQDALADPVGYWLWCGPFEDNRDEVEPWWRLCAAPGGPPRLYERLLEHSGPVPYDLKAELYDRLLPDERWHLYIYRSLNASYGDIYGQVDIERATEMYDRLVLPPDAE
jgi:hypothetical protein